MKYIYAFMVIVFTILPVSCASRPAPIEDGAIQPQGAEPATFPQTIPPEEPEPEEPFERAVWHIKKNSPLVRKFLQIDPVAGIVVKGECRIGGGEITVLYDLAAARELGGGLRIAFSALDAASGTFRNDEFFWTPAEDETGLLLSFDDDYWRTWRQYFDFFERFGARVTFFVQGALEPSGAAFAAAGDAANSGAFSGNITAIADNGGFDSGGGLADFCLEALARGHDIGFHSVSHRDLTKVSRAVFDSETVGGAAAFAGAGIPLSAFAFPFGFSQPWMEDALAPVFGITRGYGTKFRFYHPKEISGGHIISKAIDNTVYPDDGVFEREIRLMLLAAKFTGSTNIIPFTTHDIADNAKWGITPARLELLLRTAKELKLRFYTYRDFR
jgi:peptidoglycan/xylan/chitin deacetylase (PgdA/CDA1 family)